MTRADITESSVQRWSKTPIVLAGLLVVLGVTVFRDYLLLEKVYFFTGVGSDTVNLSYPYLTDVAGHMTGFRIPKWSFNYGMGHNLFPFFLRDPFDIMLFIAGKNSIYYGVAYKEFVKVVLSGLVFFYYLRLLSLSDYVAVAGSLFYAFCGFMIVGSCWNIFSFEVFNMALLLLAFELLYTRGKWYLFPLAIFLLCISQPFNLYVYCLFLALYAVFRLFQTGKFSIKNLGLVYFKLVIFGLIGILLSAPFLLENIAQLMESPRGSGVNSVAPMLLSRPVFGTLSKFELGSGIMRFFSNDMLGAGNHYNGWWNYLEIPEFYCGLPCLLLMPQVFGFLTVRLRIVFGTFMLLWLLPFVFPYFRYAFWLFSGDYYRAYSFFVGFVFIYFSLHALDFIIKARKINLPVLLLSLAALLVLLHYPFFPGAEQLFYPDSPPLHPGIFRFVLVMLVAYACLLYLMGRPGVALYARYLFMACIILEVGYLSHVTVNNMDAVSSADLAKKQWYRDHTLDAIEYIRSFDSSFYRVDKGYFSTPSRFFSLNDGMAQDYRGTSSYNSFNQLYYVRYLQLMGAANKDSESESRWAMGLVDFPILESQSCVKYILTKSYHSTHWQKYCDSLATFGDVKVLHNKYALPPGFTYSNFIRESVFSNLTKEQKSIMSLRACVVDDKDVVQVNGLKEFDLVDTIAPGAFTGDICGQYTNELKKDTLVASKFDDAGIAGGIKVNGNKMMYLSVPYDEGWILKVDGIVRDKIILNGGMTGIMLSGGDHRLEMIFDLRFFKKGLILAILGLLFYFGMVLYRPKV